MAPSERADDNVIPFPGGDLDPFARRAPAPGPPRGEVATYQVRVDLDGADPPIWRRLELASDLTLERLHAILQAAMGWTESHLHQFEIGPERDHRLQPFLTDFAAEEGDEGIHERDVRLDQVLADVGDRLFYEYDFGDGWGHTLELEAVTSYDESSPRASCTDGRRACPPEDCGGIGGYEQLLEAIAHPESATGWQRELLDWMPDGFDPSEFSVAEAEEMVKATMSGAAALESAAREGLTEPLVDLVARTGPAGASRRLGALVGAADLSDPQLPDAATRQTMVRPWLHLMELVGADGLKLTQAGRLPPAIVSRLAAELDQVEPWMGKANREDHTLPVAELRETAIAMGLVRKYKGRLLPTRIGTRLAADPQQLWAHVAAALPLGKGAERHAGAVALLVLAAGQPPRDGIRRHGPQIMESAGWWLEGGRIGEWDAYHAARPTIAVVDLLGCTTGRFDADEPTTSGRQFARAALRAAGGATALSR